jgi:hypothetical protein
MEFMGADVLLLMMAASLAAIIATVIAVYYRAFKSGSFGSHTTSQINQRSTASIDNESQNSKHFDLKEEITTSTTSIQEAPAPFPEESKSSAKTSVPADISAISGMSAVAASAAPVLVIATPKRRGRPRTKLPSTTTPGATRKRRSAKQPTISETAIPIAPIATDSTMKNETAIPSSSTQQNGA